VEELTDVQVEAVRQFTRGRVRLRHTRFARGAWRLPALDPFDADFALGQLWPILCLFRRQGHINRVDQVNRLNRVEDANAAASAIATVNALFQNLRLDLRVGYLAVDAAAGGNDSGGSPSVTVTGSPDDLAALDALLLAFDAGPS
jgi:hypothetical protein